jgi:hypothetical protein
LRLGQRQDDLRGFLELFHVIVIDVRVLAFGEFVHEECRGPKPEKDDRAVSSRSPLPWPGNPLFDDPTAKVSVDLALLGPRYSLTQDCILNLFLPSIALEPSGFEYPHNAPQFIL